MELLVVLMHLNRFFGILFRLGFLGLLQMSGYRLASILCMTQKRQLGLVDRLSAFWTLASWLTSTGQAVQTRQDALGTKTVSTGRKSNVILCSRFEADGTFNKFHFSLVKL